MSDKNNLSIKEIMDTLQKSGATGGSAYDMGQNRMGVEQGVTNNLTAGANPAMAQTKANYLAQLGKIAEMDGKLAGVYGDPTSPMYIERASQRDSATHMADSPNYKAAGTQADLYEQKKTELQDSIKSTLAVYDELTKLTKANETQAATTARNDARVSAGKGQYITDSTGNKVVVPVYKGSGSGGTSGTGTATDIKITKEQQLAGFQDPNAANYWSKIKEVEFRRWWSQNVISGKATPPKGGYTIKDIDSRYEAWKKDNPTKVTKSKASIVDQIKASK